MTPTPTPVVRISRTAPGQWAVRLVEGDQLLDVVRSKKDAERRAAFFTRVFNPPATAR